MVSVPKYCSSCGQPDGINYEAVRPTNGQPYEFTKSEAEQYLESNNPFGQSDMIIQEITN